MLEKAMAIVEANLTNQEFTVQTLVRDMGMSQSAIYRQIKSITGQSLVEFIRYSPQKGCSIAKSWQPSCDRSRYAGRN
jgi:predicted transcriptional regulator